MQKIVYFKGIPETAIIQHGILFPLEAIGTTEYRYYEVKCSFSLHYYSVKHLVALSKFRLNRSFWLITAGNGQWTFILIDGMKRKPQIEHTIHVIPFKYSFNSRNIHLNIFHMSEFKIHCSKFVIWPKIHNYSVILDTFMQSKVILFSFYLR